MPLPHPKAPEFDHRHFLDAQRRIWPAIMHELREGQKRSHWMWFVFPQLRGLGKSFYADLYGLEGIDDARAFGNHPLLGARLREACTALAEHDGRMAAAVFSEVDGLKLGSSMTLFERAFPDNLLFADIIDRYRGGRRCELTLARLDADRSWLERLLRRSK